MNISRRAFYSATLCMCYALLAGIGIYVSALWWLALLGLSLFFYDLWSKTRSPVGAAFRGAVIGFALGGAGVWWMWHMLPLPTFTDVSGATQMMIVALVWGVTALLSALTTALAAAAIYFLRGNVFIAVLTSIVWMLQEELRMWAFALYSWSPESLFGPHFSQTAIGYVLTEDALLRELASFGGISMLNFSAALIAAVMALVVRSVIEKTVTVHLVIGIGCLVVLLAVALFGRIASAAPIPTLHVAVISAIASTTPEGARGLFATAVHGQPIDLVVLPEGDRFVFSDEEVRTAFPNREVLLISSRHGQEEGAYYSELLYQNSRQGLVDIYRKIFLMPQGEYLPSIARTLFSLTANPAVDEKVKTTGNRFVRGDILTFVPFKGAVIGGLICSDIISPHLYTRLAKEHGAHILVNVANPDWFHGSRGFHNKMLQIARMHAVHTRSYFIAASVGSPSFVLTPHGEMVVQSNWDEEGVVYATLGH